MIIGIGIDLVAADRMVHWLDDDALCRRYFHPDELAAVRGRGADAALSLAARFAAKEAFLKALGRGFSGMKLRDIRVENDRFGKPHLLLEQCAHRAMIRAGARRVHLSLTHEGNMAAAQVILEE